MDHWQQYCTGLVLTASLLSQAYLKPRDNQNTLRNRQHCGQIVQNPINVLKYLAQITTVLSCSLHSPVVHLPPCFFIEALKIITSLLP